MFTFTNGEPAGHLQITRNVEALQAPFAIATLLRRHLDQDWGNISEPGIEINNQHVKVLEGAMSCYTIDTMFGQTEVWIITDNGHTTTTVMLPNDY